MTQAVLLKPAILAMLELTRGPELMCPKADKLSHAYEKKVVTKIRYKSYSSSEVFHVFSIFTKGAEKRPA